MTGRPSSRPIAGLPDWAALFLFTNISCTALLSWYTYFLWRGADKDGVSIVCTKQVSVRRGRASYRQIVTPAAHS
jgi:hypothetical protein